MIRHSHSTQSYAASNYDDDLCLKPPLLLWLAVLYLSRALLLPLMIGIGHFAGVNADAMKLMRGFWTEFELLPAMVAAPVLFAMCRRSATASRAVRWIWARGRILLAISACFDIALAIPQLAHLDFTDDMVVSLVSAAVDVYFLLYVLAARRVRDTFLEFPPLPPAER